MATVAVAEDIVTAQGVKVAVGEGGKPRELLPGESPAQSDDVIMWDGEPAFLVTTRTPTTSGGLLPDSVGLALRRAVERLYSVAADGRELESQDPEAGCPEWIVGPVETGRGLVLMVDTDGNGISPSMVQTMSAVIVSELERADVDTALAAAPQTDADTTPWRTAQERADEQND
jgi:hypothetical protein